MSDHQKNIDLERRIADLEARVAELERAKCGDIFPLNFVECCGTITAAAPTTDDCDRVEFVRRMD